MRQQAYSRSRSETILLISDYRLLATEYWLLNTDFRPTAHGLPLTAHCPQSSPPLFYREAILQQCEASYTPRCDSKHTPVRPANDTPHLQLPTTGYWLPATEYRLPANRPRPVLTAFFLPLFEKHGRCMKYRIFTIIPTIMAMYP